jgi:DnaK suppressor protein
MKPDTQHFRTLLETEKQKLESELNTIGHKSARVPGEWEATPDAGDRDRADEAEVADSLESLEENTAITTQLEGRLTEVTAALQKIEDGTYGICDVCGKPIEEDRLEANPAASTCKAHME